ncbi:MAG: hypothetical protein KJO87_09850, partial [Acidimicrobiia bacterium]|nr:hypothetical protein [Acidimicrobiia bacterium]
DGVPTTPGETRNDYFFDQGGFLIHLSCSDPFTNGWGQTAGPAEGVDTSWRIASFSIVRFKNGVFFRSCGDVVVPINVDNTASAVGSDSSGEQTVQSTDTVTIVSAGNAPATTDVEVGDVNISGKNVDIDLTSIGTDRAITRIEMEWPNGNKKLMNARLSGSVIFSGSRSPSSTTIDSGWQGTTADRTLQADTTETLRLEFERKAKSSGYTVRVYFDDGTFVEVVI